MNNETLRGKLEEFINIFESETEQIKKQVHYNSTINIANQLLDYNHSKVAENYKVQIIEYMDELKITDLPTGKNHSIALYHKYILGAGIYLVSKRDFRQKGTNEVKYIALGIILDLLDYYFFKSIVPFYLPIFTLIFTIMGIRRMKRAVAEKKAFGIGF